MVNNSLGKSTVTERKGLQEETVQKLINAAPSAETEPSTYGGWNFNSGNYLFTTDTK